MNGITVALIIVALVVGSLVTLFVLALLHLAAESDRTAYRERWKLADQECPLCGGDGCDPADPILVCPACMKEEE